MQDSLNEMMPWGLTLAQSICLGGGFFLLIFGWSFLQLIFKIGKTVFTLGLVLVILLACCGGIVFLLGNAA